jgi:hypothetical protein
MREVVGDVSHVRQREGEGWYLEVGRWRGHLGHVDEEEDLLWRGSDAFHGE